MPAVTLNNSPDGCGLQKENLNLRVVNENSVEGIGRREKKMQKGSARN